MKFTPPIGSTDPDAPFIDANPAAGIKGSIVPAAAIEPSMREIVNAIIASGQTPDGANLTQLTEAIKVISGNLPASILNNILVGKANGAGWENKTPEEVKEILEISSDAGKININADNITNIGIDNLFEAIAPDMEKGFSVSTGTVPVTVNGWLFVYSPMATSGTNTITRNGKNVYVKEDNDYGFGYHKTSNTDWIQVVKGDTLVITGTYAYLILYPCKGV